jgi:hypothetical protein
MPNGLIRTHEKELEEICGAAFSAGKFGVDIFGSKYVRLFHASA